MPINAAEVAVEEIKSKIDSDLISDRSIDWLSCCEALEEIADHARDWAKQIRSEHE